MKSVVRLAFSICLWFAVLCPAVAFAFPQVEEPSSNLTLTCGVPEEFEAAPPLAAPQAEESSLRVASVPEAVFDTPAAVPEPSTFLLLAAGLAGLCGIRRRRRR